ncbi:uncharacterized protein BDV17DRAFT_269256 [Aspergillus undulatus]|uniref:uncharacterized protein n=1 Tax=Aspergillus undulatus TaxID=1810928 RepID=UPI003CCCF57D
MGLLSVLSAPFFILIVYPVYYVAFSAYFILSLVASPFIYLGSWVIWFALLPVRLIISLKVGRPSTRLAAKSRCLTGPRHC